MDKLSKILNNQVNLIWVFLKSQNIVTVYKQTSWQLLGKFSTSLSTLLILGMIARTYQAEGTGVFTLALTYLSFFYMTADFGINASVIQRFIKGDLDSEWRKLLGFRLTLSFLLVILAVLGVYFWPGGNEVFKESVLIGALAILGSSIYVSANAIFQYKQRFDLSAISLALGAFLSLILTFAAISQDLGVPSLLVGYMAGWLLCGTVALYLASGYTRLLPVINFKYIREILHQSWPISATLILNVIYFRADSFILAALKPIADVGIYNLSFQIFQFLLVIPTFIMNSFYPILLKIFNEDKPYFVSLLTKAGVVMFGVAFLGTLATFVLALPVVAVVSGGGQFGGSVASLWILSMGFPAFFVSALLMWTLIVLKRYKEMLFIYAFGLLFNVVLNFLLIPQYSFLAASAVTVISEYLILLAQIVVLIGVFKNLK